MLRGTRGGIKLLLLRRAAEMAEIAAAGALTIGDRPQNPKWPANCGHDGAGRARRAGGRWYGRPPRAVISSRACCERRRCGESGGAEPDGIAAVTSALPRRCARADALRAPRGACAKRACSHSTMPRLRWKTRSRRRTKRAATRARRRARTSRRRVETADRCSEDIEEAFDFGELGTVEASAIDNLLKAASAQDLDAEASDLSVTERDAHIKRAIELKKEILTEIATRKPTTSSTRFAAALTPPGAPPALEARQQPAGTPAPLLGKIEEDAEWWAAFREARASAASSSTPTVPADGWLTGCTSRATPSPATCRGRGQPAVPRRHRATAVQWAAEGDLDVEPAVRAARHDRHLLLLGGPALHPVRDAASMKGEILSFDTRGGTWSIFSSQPGSSVSSSGGTGLQQNPGMLWNAIAHPNVELDVQWVEEPLVPVVDLGPAMKEMLRGRQGLGGREGTRQPRARKGARRRARRRQVREPSDRRGLIGGRDWPADRLRPHKAHRNHRDQQRGRDEAGKGHHGKAKQKYEIDLAHKYELQGQQGPSLAKSLAAKVP